MKRYVHQLHVKDIIKVGFPLEITKIGYDSRLNSVLIEGIDEFNFNYKCSKNECEEVELLYELNIYSLNIDIDSSEGPLFD
jgi:hypothetical protein